MNKESFKFSYNIPSLDWYTTKNVEIEWDDYAYFKLEYRYGDTYWLIGYTKPGQSYAKELGEISKNDLDRFIKWCEFDYPDNYHKGNKLVDISVISTGMNIISVIQDIIKGRIYNA